MVFAAGTIVLGTLLYWTLLPIFPGLQATRMLPMAPSTAVCIALLAWAQLSRKRQPCSGPDRGALTILGLIVIPFCALAVLSGGVEGTLCGSIEHHLFHIGGTLHGYQLGHMSPLTAAAILCMSIAFVVFRLNTRRFVRAACCIMNLIAVLGTATALVTYLYGAPLLSTAPVPPMALPTAAALFLLGSSALASQYRWTSPVNLLLGPSTRARLLRSLLPVTILLTLLEGWPDALGFSWASENTVIWAVFTTAVFASVIALATTWVAHHIGNDIDTTKERLRQTEEALRSHNLLMRTVIDAIPDSLMVIDTDYRILLANKHVQDEFGNDPIACRLTCHQVSHHEEKPCDGIEHPCPARAAIDTKQPVTVEHIHFTGSGERRFVEVTAVPVMNEQGKVVKVVECCRDVTERKQQEELLRSHSAFLQQLIDAIPTPVIYKDANRVHRLVNKALAESFNLPVSEIVGKTLSDIYGPELARIHDQHDRLLLETGVSQSYEATFANADGSPRHVVVNKAATFDKDGRIDGFVGVVFNITERKRAAEALNEREALYRGIVDSANDAIMLTENGLIADCNTKATELFGCSREQLLGRSPEEFSPTCQPDGRSSRDAADEHIAAALAGQRPRFEWQHCRADGSVFDAEVSLSRLDVGGKTLVQGLVHDISNRKRVQQALRASEERLRALFDAAPVAIFSLTPEGIVTSWNAAATRIFGFSGDDAIGNALPIIPGDSIDEFRERIQAIMAGEEVSNVELRRKRKDGSLVDVSLSAAPLYDHSGKAIGVMSIIIDISKRKRTEATLQRLSKAVEQSPALILITDVRGRIEYVNPKFEQITGYSADEVVGQNPRILKSGAATRECYAEMWSALQAGNEWRGEFQNRKKSGELYWESASISPIRDAAGNITHFVAVKEDITQRKAAEHALRESEAMLARAQQLANLGSWEWDVRTGELRWSDQHFRIFGLHREEFTPSLESVLGKIHPEDRDRVRMAVEESLTGRQRYSLEYRIIRSDQSIRVLFAQGDIDFDEAGTPARMVGTVLDITERKAAEELQARRAELEHERNALRDSVKAMEQVIGVVGHELRTPLAGLRAVSELLLDAEASTAEHTTIFLGTIHSEVLRLSEMVNTMLEAARISSGAAQWKWGDVDLLVACEAAVEAVRPLVDVSCVSLICDVDPPDLTMRGDPDAIRRLVLNLISNAQKHTPKGEIAIQVRPAPSTDGARVKIEIADTGEGIAPEIASKLGEPFALNSGITGGGCVKGSGLGLAICRGIVAAHGGTISVKSTLQVGTTISILLCADLQEPASLKGVEIKKEISV